MEYGEFESIEDWFDIVIVLKNQRKYHINKPRINKVSYYLSGYSMYEIIDGKRATSDMNCNNFNIGEIAFIERIWTNKQNKNHEIEIERIILLLFFIVVMIYILFFS
jgi:hypothetical protein